MLPKSDLIERSIKLKEIIDETFYKNIFTKEFRCNNDNLIVDIVNLQLIQTQSIQILKLIHIIYVTSL